MNKLPTLPIIEWSPEGCRIVDPIQRKVIEAPTASDCLSLAGKPKQVILALARRQTFVKTISLPNVGKVEALNILQFQIDDVFPVESAELSYDIEQTKLTDSDGRQTVVIAVKADVLRQAKRDIESTGTKIIRQIPATLGSAVIAESKAQDPALVVSNTPEGTAFDVVSGGSVIYTRIAAKDLTIEQQNAEAVRTLASAKVVSAPIIFESDQSGTGSPLSSFVSILDSHTDLDIRLPEYRDAQETKLVNSRRSLAVLLFGATICIAAMFYMDRDDLNIKIAKETKKWDKELEAFTDRKALLAPRLSSAEDNQKLIINLMQPKQYASDVVKTVSNLVTEGVWLTGISFERGKPILIKGTAKNQNQIAEFVTSLSTSERLRDVTLSFANDTKIEETAVAQFSISAHVIGNFPLDEPKKSTSRR